MPRRGPRQRFSDQFRKSPTWRESRTCTANVTVQTTNGLIWAPTISGVPFSRYNVEKQKDLLDEIVSQLPGKYQKLDYAWAPDGYPNEPNRYGECVMKEGTLYVNVTKEDPHKSFTRVYADVLAKAILELEKESIESMSFTPTELQFDKLLQKAKMVGDELSQLSSRNPDESLDTLDSNLSKVKTLIPPSRDPNDSLLVKFGKKKQKNEAVVDDEGSFVIMTDTKPPLVLSSGPNGVLLECQDPENYGPNRVNLFDGNSEKTMRLLRDYIEFRDDHKGDVFKLYVDQFKECIERQYFVYSEGRDENKVDFYLNPEYRQAYTHVYELLDLIYKSPKGLDTIIGVKSFCQTWLRNDNDGSMAVSRDTYKPQFSIMSPHFQTRFYIKNAEALSELVYEHLTTEHLFSYLKIIQLFTDGMLQGGYGGPRNQSFVDIDGMLERFDNTRHVKRTRQYRGIRTRT